MSQTQKVELVQAFLWTCDKCGRDQFERAVSIDPEAIEGTEMAEIVDAAVSRFIDSSEDIEITSGDWLIAPDCVKCNHCGAEFEVKD